MEEEEEEEEEFIHNGTRRRSLLRIVREEANGTGEASTTCCCADQAYASRDHSNHRHGVEQQKQSESPPVAQDTKTLVVMPLSMVFVAAGGPTTIPSCSSRLS